MLFLLCILVVNHYQKLLGIFVFFNRTVNDSVILSNVMTSSQRLWCYINICYLFDQLRKIMVHLLFTILETIEKFVRVCRRYITCGCTCNCIVVLHNRDLIQWLPICCHSIINIFLITIHIDHSSRKQSTLSME